MNYEEFLSKIQPAVKNKLGNDYEVCIHHVTKNNCLELVGLLIFKCSEEGMSPNIYMENFYEKYQSGESVEQITDDIIRIYEKSNMLNADKFLPEVDFESSKKVITYHLVGYQKNKKLLAEIPHIRFLDLAITFHYLYSHNREGIQSFRITNDMMNKWNIKVKELFQIANENTQRIFPVTIRTMDEIIGEIIKEDLKLKAELIDKQRMDDIEPEDLVQELFEAQGKDLKPFWVMSNESGINGASTLVYPHILKKFADQCKTDIYVLPSSIHEVILAPKTNDMNEESLNRMVQEVNEKEVPAEDILSDHVYLYMRETNTFKY